MFTEKELRIIAHACTALAVRCTDYGATAKEYVRIANKALEEAKNATQRQD